MIPDIQNMTISKTLDINPKKLQKYKLTVCFGVNDLVRDCAVAIETTRRNFASIQEVLAVIGRRGSSGRVAFNIV